MFSVYIHVRPVNNSLATAASLSFKVNPRTLRKLATTCVYFLICEIIQSFIPTLHSTFYWPEGNWDARTHAHCGLSATTLLQKHYRGILHMCVSVGSFLWGGHTMIITSQPFNGKEPFSSGQLPRHLRCSYCPIISLILSLRNATITITTVPLSPSDPPHPKSLSFILFFVWTIIS